MAVTGVSQGANLSQLIKPSVLPSAQEKSLRPAADGDSPSIEKTENAATKLSEKQNGGFNKLV